MDTAIGRARADLLLRQRPAVLAANLIIMTALGIVRRCRYGDPVIFAWFATSCALSGLCVGEWQRFTRSEGNDPATVRRWTVAPRLLEALGLRRIGTRRRGCC